MSPDLALSANPVLSPAFGRAQWISKMMAILLTVGFWVTLAWLICTPLALFIPNIGSVSLGSAILRAADLSSLQRVSGAAAVAIATLPSLFILHHARRAFGHFAKGDVFAAAPIAHIRGASLGLMLSMPAFLAGAFLVVGAGITTSVRNTQLSPITFFFGIGLYVAAYVMAEARRIADDNAGIV